MRLAIVRLVYTSMANADDVLSGDSYFMAELKSIRRLFDIETHMPVYCFIDEIFKGTNTTERIAASESVLSYLNHQPEYRIVAATHDIELSELLRTIIKTFTLMKRLKTMKSTLITRLKR